MAPEGVSMRADEAHRGASEASEPKGKLMCTAVAAPMMHDSQRRHHARHMMRDDRYRHWCREREGSGRLCLRVACSGLELRVNKRPWLCPHR